MERKRKKQSKESGVMKSPVRISRTRNPGPDTDTRTLEEALALALRDKQRAEAILDAAGEAISVQDRDFRVIYQNRRHRELAHGDFSGEFCFRAYEREDRVCPGCPIALTFSDGKPHRVEKKVKAGLYLEISASPLHDKSGSLIGGIEIVRDITARVAAQERIALYSRALEEAMDGIQITDPQGTILYSNKAVERMYGFTSKELEGKSVASMNADPVIAEQLIIPSIRETGRWSGELEVLHKEGWTFPVWLSASIVRADDGQPLAMIGVIRDVSERKRIENELRSHRENLMEMVAERTSELNLANKRLIKESSDLRRATEALLKSEQRNALHIRQTPLGVIEWDLACHVTLWNPAAERIFSSPSRDALGRHASFIVPESERKQAFEVWNDLLRTKSSNKSINLNVTGDGRKIWCEWYNTPLVDSRGEVIGVASLVQDITDRRMMEEHLIRAEKLESVGLLAGGIAHDFNNLLTSILGNLSLGLMYTDQQSMAHKRLVKAEQASIRAKDLTQQLLTFSKGGEPVRQAIAIADLITETAGFAVRGSKVKCRFDIAEDLWPVDADEGQLSQVIGNLVINADQAMPEGGVVTVSARNLEVSDDRRPPLKQVRYVSISIKDHGVGISDEQVSRIFDPYFTTKPKGSGLGLAMAFSIIKRHDGHISVESSLGVGTIFHVHIPAARSGPRPVPAGAAPLLSGRGRLLFMDDDQSIADVAAGMLESLGYEMDYAEEGGAAVSLFSKALEAGTPYDAVVLDLTVPGGMGGREAVEKILALDPRAKVIVSSGYSNDAVMADYRRYGFVEVMTKPYRIEELSRVVHSVLQCGE